MCSGLCCFCAVSWAFLGLKYLYLAFIVQFPGLFIPVPAILALPCSVMPPLAGCPGSQCSAICQGGSSASLLFPCGSSLWPDIHRCPEEASSCCPGRLGAGLSLPSATLAQHPISNLALSRALLMATCLLSQETWFLFLSLTSALTLQRAWPGSFPGLNWVLSTPSPAPPVLMPAEQLAEAMRRAMN